MPEVKLLPRQKESDTFQIMEIETSRLILREYTPGDWERIHIYGSEPKFSQFETWGPNSVEDSKKFISASIFKSQKNPRYEFELAVCLKNQNLQIGGCGLRRDTELSAIGNIGWAMNPEFQGKGYTTEAAAALIQFGFEALNLAVIYAVCDRRNIASYRVMEKLGMKRAGHMLGDRKIDGNIFDSFRYEILQLV